MRQLVLSLILWSFALPALAQQTGLPALYDVYDVIHPDTLNVRDGPDSSFPDIGDLKADATRLEVIMTDERGEWGLIRWGEGEGWVSMRYLRRRASDLIAGQAIEKGLSCAGTEPFWYLEFQNNGTVVFDDFNSVKEDYQLRWSGYSINRGDHWPLGFALENGPVRITAMMHREYCSDGMSDIPFGIRLNMILIDGNDVTMVSGCCSLESE